MKQCALFAILALAFFFSGCASQPSALDDTSAAGSVPGEKVNGEDRLAPGAGANPSASVRW